MRISDWLRVGLSMFVVAFGANAFAPLMVSYRLEAGLSDGQVTAFLAIYIVGLIPALIIGGPLSDTYGRRALIRPALVLSFFGSAVLALGAFGPAFFIGTGRFITGLATGLVMASGAAWLKQLSAGPSIQGARRATIALTSGFAGGPLVAGLVAEFLPKPDLLPYLLHLVLVTLITPLVWNTPTVTTGSSGKGKLFASQVATKRFWLTLGLSGPWVFGAASTAFAVNTRLLEAQMDHPVVYTGSIACLAMVFGNLIQRFVGTSRTYPPAFYGLSLIIVGMLCSICVALWQDSIVGVIFGLLATIPLGFAYGILMSSGLQEAQRQAPDEELGAASASFYSLTYIGFVFPFVISILGPAIGYITCFAFGIAMALFTIFMVLRFDGRFFKKSRRRAQKNPETTNITRS